eukprot:2516590-Amphidinium_carterae.1
MGSAAGEGDVGSGVTPMGFCAPGQRTMQAARRRRNLACHKGEAATSSTFQLSSMPETSPS